EDGSIVEVKQFTNIKCDEANLSGENYFYDTFASFGKKLTINQLGLLYGDNARIAGDLAFIHGSIGGVGCDVGLNKMYITPTGAMGFEQTLMLGSSLENEGRVAFHQVDL